MEAAKGPSESAGGFPGEESAQVLRTTWPVPLLAGGAVALVAGLAVAIAHKPEPNYEPPLERAEALIERGEFEPAISELNAGFLPYYNDPVVTNAQRERYHLTLARALYDGNELLIRRQAANSENALAQYSEAEKLGADLNAEDRFQIADSLVKLERYEPAAEALRAIPADRPDLRLRHYRNLIGSMLEERRPDYPATLDLLADMLGEPRLGVEDRVWALARQADIRHSLGFHDETITQLLRQIPTILADDASQIAELHLALGRAYLAVAAYGEAEKELARVESESAIPPGTPLRASLLRMMGDLYAQQADDRPRLEVARASYSDVVQSYADTDSYLPSLLGLAELEAALDNTAGSLEAYATLIDAMRDTTEWHDPSPERVIESLLDRYDENMSLGGEGVDHALAYAQLAGEVLPVDDAPPAVLEALGSAHRASAAKALLAGLGDQAPVVSDTADPASAFDELELPDIAVLDPATREQVKRHLIRAAIYFRTHADRFVIDDLQEHGESLWTAARLYDRAGDKPAAIAAYEEFSATLPDDPRNAEARYRLGQAFQAMGDFLASANQYRALIADSQREGIQRVGPWADRSRVPLAQALVHDNDPSNDAEAESLLQAVVTGASGGPSSDLFDDALLEYGRLLYRAGRFNEAIERFDEMLERFPDHPDKAIARFMLADSHRKLAGAIGERLQESLRDSERTTLAAERERRLSGAISLFGRVKEELEAKPRSRRSGLEETMLRNAHFYLGDCAFDLGDPDAAISHYSTARTRYPRDPAVLVALIQIVNAYIAKGDLASARTANERARDFYLSLPEDVWDDPLLPMGRRDWERWLDSSSRLYEGLASGD